jgi:hypothetical protein
MNPKYLIQSIAVFLLLGILNQVAAQEITFGLKGSSLELLKSDFDIVEVLDARNQKLGLGRIYTANNQTAESKIAGGMTQGIKRYFNNSINKSTNPRPIQVRIQELNLSEKRENTTVVSGELKLKLAFYIKGTFDPVHLVEYQTGMNYRRSVNRTDLVEQVLDQALRKSLQFFNDWLIEHSSTHHRLAKQVRIELRESSRKSDRDTVFYDPSRPVRWADFRDKPNSGSRFNAVIFTSLALEGSPFVSDGTIIMPLEVKVYMLPSSSWVKSQSDYSLNHEQRHFDVTRIVGNRLKSTLLGLDVNPDNYDALVNDAFFDAFREMNRLQEIYDSQTQHGLDKAAQAHWNEMIDEALKGNMTQIEELLAADKKQRQGRG